MPNIAPTSSGGSLRAGRHERGGSTTMTLEKTAEIAGQGGYPTLLLKGSVGEKEKSPQLRRAEAMEAMVEALSVVDQPAAVIASTEPAAMDVDQQPRPASSQRRSVAAAEQNAGPSHVFTEEVHDVYLPQSDAGLPNPDEVPPTPRGGESLARPHFPIEAALSPRDKGKLPATHDPARYDGENALHDQRLRGLAEAAAAARASQETAGLVDLIAEVAKVIRKMYHLAWEREQAGAAPKADPIVKAQDICQISQSSVDSRDSRSEHNASTSSLPQTAEPKSLAILHWLEGMYAELGSPPGLPALVLAAKLAPADGDGLYEQTLVGDIYNLPTKLPPNEQNDAQIAEEVDEVDRVSLTAELPIRAWISELLKRTSVSCSQVKVAACYLIALHPHIQAELRKRQEAAHAISTNQPLLHYSASPLTCPRRTLVAALILASKFLGEKVYSMKAWARVTGLEAPDLVQSEQAIGTALKWDLWVGANVESLRSDIFKRTLLKMVSAPGAKQMGRPWPQEQHPALYAPQGEVQPQPNVQKEIPSVPAAHARELPVSSVRDDAPPAAVSRKRSHAAVDVDPKQSEVRAQKRKVIERLMPTANGGGCGPVIKSEPVDEQRLVGEAY